MDSLNFEIILAIKQLYYLQNLIYGLFIYIYYYYKVYITITKVFRPYINI